MPVKLIIIYPRPKDVRAFETVYKNQHVPMAVEKLGGKTKVCRDPGARVSERGTRVPPHCRGSLSLDARTGGLRGVGRWQTDACECSRNLIWWTASLSSSGGGDL